MDPLSITVSSISLASAIGKLTITLSRFVRDVRDARSDIDAVSRELHSLKNVLELLVEDAESLDARLPESLESQIATVVANCTTVVGDIDKCILSHKGSRVQIGIRWSSSGKGDIAKLRSTLEAHKATLGIALDMMALTTIREVKRGTDDIKADTTEILQESKEIKDDTEKILKQIAELQAKLPGQVAEPFQNLTLQRYLDNMTTYAETVVEDIREEEDSSTSEPIRSRPSSPGAFAEHSTSRSAGPGWSATASMLDPGGQRQETTPINGNRQTVEKYETNIWDQNQDVNRKFSHGFTLERALEAAKRRRRWIFLYLEDPADAKRRSWYRTIWKAPEVGALLAKRFIFLQISKDDPEIEKFSEMYNQIPEEYPYLCLLRPDTSQVFEIYSGPMMRNEIYFVNFLTSFLATAAPVDGSLTPEENFPTRRKYTWRNVRDHSGMDDIWIVVNGKVYDVTDFLGEHPGGESVLRMWAGQDATSEFEEINHSDDARTMMSRFLIGEVSSGLRPGSPGPSRYKLLDGRASSPNLQSTRVVRNQRNLASTSSTEPFGVDALQPRANPQQGRESHKLSPSPYVPTISQDERARYDHIFRQWDSSNDGFMGKAHAIEIFGQSGLPKQELEQVWTLVDPAKQDRLNMEEFGVAMHLMYRRLNGHPLPTRLPANV